MYSFGCCGGGGSAAPRALAASRSPAIPPVAASVPPLSCCLCCLRAPTDAGGRTAAAGASLGDATGSCAHLLIGIHTVSTCAGGQAGVVRGSESAPKSSSWPSDASSLPGVGWWVQGESNPRPPVNTGGPGTSQWTLIGERQQQPMRGCWRRSERSGQGGRSWRQTGGTGQGTGSAALAAERWNAAAALAHEEAGRHELPPRAAGIVHGA
jgi:hypothetical protein